jgi:hypothetical protein
LVAVVVEIMMVGKRCDDESRKKQLFLITVLMLEVHNNGYISRDDKLVR